jgi:hypothetical protein
MHTIGISQLRRSLVGAAVMAALATVAQAETSDAVRGAPSEANHFIATPDGWVHPTTSWGDPDIQATLNMMQAAGVPFERCLAGTRGRGGAVCDPNKVWNTDEDYQAAVQRAAGAVDQSRLALEQGDLGRSMSAGILDPSIPQRQMNLIDDPPDGRLPDVTAWAKQRAHEMGSDWALPGESIDFQDQFDFDSWDRCSTRGLPSMMMPYRYNGGFKIHQSPGYVVFSVEMIHEARVIPVGDVPPLDPEIKQLLGESRGHWEGNTLVVETTNFNADPKLNLPLMNLAVLGAPPGNRFATSERLKVTERVTRLNDEWWLYEITTEDPDVLTAPFTVRYPMHHDAAYWWPEYACHEDNVIVPNYVSANRAERANPTAEPEQAPQQVGADLARMLDGRWIGRPDVHTIDYDIEIEFTDNGNGTVNAELIGTTLRNGAINKPLRAPMVGPIITPEGAINFTFPNSDPWRYAGQINAADQTITGNTSSAQGGVPLNFAKAPRN